MPAVPVGLGARMTGLGASMRQLVTRELSGTTVSGCIDPGDVVEDLPGASHPHHSQ